MQRFARELNAAINGGRITVAKLSELTGLSRMHIYRLMRAEAAPSLDTAESIAKHIGVRISITKA